MGDTKIEWSDAVWNPVRGCARVSEGCRNCYAERMAHRFSGPGQPYEGLTHARGDGPPHWTGWARFVPEMLEVPLRWRKPRRVFVNSMSDLFHDHVTNEQIAAVFGVIALGPQHTFQILTKRPTRMLEWFRWLSAKGNGYRLDAYPGGPADRGIFEYAIDAAVAQGEFGFHVPRFVGWPLPNVHLGVSVEDQAAADEWIPLLLQCPAVVRWVSAEPLLGPVNLRHMDVEAAGHRDWCQIDALTGRHTDMGRPCRDVPRLDWVVVGGESGPGARPMHPAWAQSLRDQAVDAGVPFFFKQWGEFGPGSVRTSTGEPVFREFDTFQRWVDKAQTWLRPGDACLDAEGRRCLIGRDMMRARDEGTFPVTVVTKLGKKKAGRILDGRTWDEVPA